MLLYLFDAICWRGGKRCANSLIYGWSSRGMVVYSHLDHCPVFWPNLQYSGDTYHCCLTFCPLLGPRMHVQEDRHAWLLLLSYPWITRLVFLHSPLLLLVLSISYLNIHYFCISSFSYTSWLLFFYNSITVTFHFWSFPNFLLINMWNTFLFYFFCHTKYT